MQESAGGAHQAVDRTVVRCQKDYLIDERSQLREWSEGSALRQGPRTRSVEDSPRRLRPPPDLEHKHADCE